MYKFHEEKISICNKFHEKNQCATSSTNETQHATSSMTKIGFARRKKQGKTFTRRNFKTFYIFTEQKLYCNKFHERKSACNKFLEQKSLHNKFLEQKSARNKFHEQKSTCSKSHEQISFTWKKIKIKVSRREKNKIQLLFLFQIFQIFVPRTKISSQQVSRTKISMQEIPIIKISFKKRKINVQVSRSEKSAYNRFLEQKSARKCFRKKNQHATSSLRVNSVFTWRKINIQISPRENSTCNKFHEHNQIHEEKINVQVSRREKSTCKNFHKQKFAPDKFHEQKSARKKLHL